MLPSTMWSSETHDTIQVLTWIPQRSGQPVDWNGLGKALIDQPHQRWVVDLSPVPLVTSEALAQIMGAARRVRQQGGRIALAGLSPSLRQVAASVRLDRLVEIQPTVAQAATALSA
jgi:anti-anti-sigma factor